MYSKRGQNAQKQTSQILKNYQPGFDRFRHDTGPESYKQ